jgi:hypothetical protein
MAKQQQADEKARQKRQETQRSPHSSLDKLTLCAIKHRNNKGDKHNVKPPYGIPMGLFHWVSPVLSL